ncbi:MAG TPA: flagellar biosynthetic protein FliO, partial [Friedmanniella sp.]
METVVLGARTLLALACVCGLIWVLARRAGWGKGRRRPAGPTIQVVGRQALGRHAGVAVVAVGERRLLVGFGDQQVTMLTELDPVEVDVDVEVDEHADVEAAGRTAPVLPSGPTGLAGLAALGKKPLVRRRVAQPVTTTPISTTSAGTTSVSTTPAGTTPVAATTVPIAALPVSAGAHQVEAVDFDAALRGAIALEDTARDRGTPDGTA